MLYDVFDDVLIGGVFLHGLRGALFVHEDDTGLCEGGKRCHVGVVL